MSAAAEKLRANAEDLLSKAEKLERLLDDVLVLARVREHQVALAVEVSRDLARLGVDVKNLPKVVLVDPDLDGGTWDWLFAFAWIWGVLHDEKFKMRASAHPHPLIDLAYLASPRDVLERCPALAIAGHPHAPDIERWAQIKTAAMLEPAMRALPGRRGAA